MTHSWLLDGNVLAALSITSHVHHDSAHVWFHEHVDVFATCCITQGTLLRVHMLMSQHRSASAAWEALAELTGHPKHVFWEDAFGYHDVSFRYIQGAKQITDAWLAELARKRKAKLATFDNGLAMLHKDVAVPIAVASN